MYNAAPQYIVKTTDAMSEEVRPLSRWRPGHLSLPSPYMRICRGPAPLRSVIHMTQTHPQTRSTAGAVRFTGAAKVFGDVRAVDGIDLEIRRGETVALLGRNGAGKSTAISLLLGLNEPDAGAVRLFGGAPGAGGRSRAASARCSRTAGRSRG